MQLRNLTIPYAQPAVFAPMAGFTDAACRHLMADHGAAWTVSEMASAKAITFGDDKSVRLLRDKASHGIYAVQLFGAEPETMAQAIRIIQEKGVQFDILDINMGCPAPKITSSGAGSKLMQDPELCGRMVAAARGALGPDKPLTVKMRIGWDAEQLTGVAVARQCEANGADLIAVHGRTREQMYIPPIDVDAITEIRKAVGIPVLANGDITTAEDAKQILEQTGCAGVMIGRGAMGNPWIFYLGALCMLGVIVALVCKYIRLGRRRLELRHGDGDLSLYTIVIGFAAQFLPWVLVPRSMYMYHYFASVPFIILATVWWIGRIRKPKARAVVLAVYLTGAAVFFVMFFPYASGWLPSTQWLDSMKWVSKIYGGRWFNLYY